jgi:hypothetical protein
MRAMTTLRHDVVEPAPSSGAEVVTFRGYRESTMAGPRQRFAKAIAQMRDILGDSEPFLQLLAERLTFEGAREDELADEVLVDDPDGFSFTLGGATR